MNNQTEKEWLKQLQQDLITDRENEKTQANPVYYGIYDFKEQPVPEGHEDRMEFYNPDSCETVTPQSYFDELEDDEKEELFDNDDSGISKDEDGNFYIDCEADFVNYLSETYGFVPVYLADVGYVCTDCMFLTRNDAQSHLDKNRHHYTADAKTYAMTAWRSPRVEHLLKLLTKIDWDNSSITLKND